MFRIGEFSRIVQLSVRVLRHYDEIGLLVPARVDPASGYRHYSPAQLADAHRIIALKELGLSLEQIRKLTAEQVSTEELAGMLQMESARAGDNQGRLTVLGASDGRRPLVRVQGDREPRTASIWTAPAVDARGDAYIATQTGWIYGFGPDGRQLFALNAGSAINSYPAIGGDGTLYFATVRGDLFAIADP